MSLSAVGNLFHLIRELNLNEIKEEVERPFSLLVAGAEPAARALAEQLSTEPGKVGTHPWITVQPLPLPLETSDLSRHDLALLVAPTPELSEGEASSLRRLHEAKVPVVVVVVNEAVGTLVGAALARPREAARVALATLDPALLQAQLVPAIVRVAPERLKLALARQLPLLRPPAVRELVEETSRANALYAASTGLAEVVPVLNIPLNAADIIVLTKNQLVMAYKIALATGKQGEPREILGEVASVLGGGFLFRQIARELVGLIPVVGIVPKVAVSYAGTWVIGRTVYLWATEGERVNASEMRRFYDEALRRGRTLAESLVERFREEPEALPPPADGSAVRPRRWWQRWRHPRVALPAPNEGENGLRAEPAGEGDATLWQRLRRKLPF